MSMNQILLCTNMLSMISVSWSAPLEEPISFVHQYFNQDTALDDEYYKAQTSNSTNIYRKRKTEEGYLSLCWTESLIAKEDKKTNNVTLSKSYSIILESPIDLDREVIESNNTACYEVVQNGTNGKRIYNVTTIKETDEYLVKEHKTLFCGAGPVLSEHLIVWPKLNKKQIEISINPVPPTDWRNCNEISESPMKLFTPASEHNSGIDDINDATIRSMKGKTTKHKDDFGITVTENTFSDTFENPEVVGDFPIVEIGDNDIDDDGENITKSLGNRTDLTNLRNILLKRDVNCTSEYQSEFCKELLDHSEILKDFQSNSSPALMNMFFPNEAFLHFFRDFDDNRSFYIRGKLILEVKERSLKNDTAHRNMVSRIEVREDSLIASSSNGSVYEMR